jgi:hypothetical protein
MSGGSGVGDVVVVAVAAAVVLKLNSSPDARRSGVGGRGGGGRRHRRRGGGRGIGDVVVAAVVATAAEGWQWWATTYGRWPAMGVFAFFIVFQKSLPRAISALGTRVPSGIHMALGIGPFAGPAVPSALCRE